MKLLNSLAASLAVLLGAQAWAHGSLAELSVYDRTEGRRAQVYWHEGKAYVVGTPGNEYQVTVRNRLGEELLAVVSVDGVNVITGETADPSQSGYVLAPRSALDIRGWRKSLARTAAFYFTSIPDSYAARTGRPHDVGVIGVALFRRKPAEPPAPVGRIAPADRASGAGASADAAKSAESSQPRLGTGWGRDETSHARFVAFERASAEPAEVITLYYDSHRNLVARGVIREPVPVAPLPRPFPGFAPPPQG
jgi:hypothetical protein